MGEAARKPGCPELPKTPLELLTPRPGEGFTPFQYYVWPVTGVASGLAATTIYNFLNCRPVWAGLPIHVTSAAIGFSLFTFFRNQRFASRAHEDAVLRHYITLHPEDFPPFERKRWRDVYKPFDPIR